MARRGGAASVSALLWDSHPPCLAAEPSTLLSCVWAALQLMWSGEGFLLSQCNSSKCMLFGIYVYKKCKFLKVRRLKAAQLFHHQPINTNHYEITVIWSWFIKQSTQSKNTFKLVDKSLCLYSKAMTMGLMLITRPSVFSLSEQTGPTPWALI